MHWRLLAVGVFLQGCSLSLQPTITLKLVSSDPTLRASNRNPGLESLRYAVVFSGGGAAQTYSFSSLKGRDPTCVRLAGTVSPLYSYTQITTTGIPVTIPQGQYQLAIVGFAGVPASTATVSDAWNAATVESYPIASGSVNTATSSSATLTENYLVTNPDNLSVVCPDTFGGNHLNLSSVFGGNSGVASGPLLFGSAEGAIPPFNGDGSQMAVYDLIDMFLPHYVYSNSVANAYYPRIDLVFGTSSNVLNNYTSLSVNVNVDTYSTPVIGGRCDIDNGGVAIAGDYVVQVFVDSNSWVGSISNPAQSRTVSVNVAPLGRAFTLNSRAVGGVLVSIRNQVRSVANKTCAGLKLNSTVFTLTP